MTIWRRPVELCRVCGRPDDWSQVLARVAIEIDTAREEAEELLGTDRELYSRGYLEGMLIIAEHIGLPREEST